MWWENLDVIVISQTPQIQEIISSHKDDIIIYNVYKTRPIESNTTGLDTAA